MEDVFDATWREHPATHDAPIDAQLASLIDIYGIALLDDPKQVRALLAKACPDSPSHVAAVLAALNAGIPARLHGAQDDETLPELLRQSAKALREQSGLDAEWSTWAVRAWAHAFALPTSPVAAARFVAAPAPIHPPMLNDALELSNATTIGRLWDQPTVRPVQPVEPAHDEDVPITNAPVFPTDPADETPLLVEPLFPDRDPGFETDPIVPPTRDRPLPPPRRSLAAPIAIGVLVLVLAAGAWFALEGMPGSAPITRSAATPAAAPAPIADAPTPTLTPTPPPPPPPALAETAPVVEPAEMTPVPASPQPEPRRPVIARVDVPRVIEGDPFNVVVQLGGNVRDVVSVERRIVDSGGAWPQMATVLQATSLRSGERALQIPFRSMDAPSHATIDFIAIGRDGSRSAPQRVMISLVGAAPPVASAASTACTASTCGTVIESGEIEGGGGAPIYQITVRLDNRQTLVSTAPYRLQVGSRARIAGNRLVPVEAN